MIRSISASVSSLILRFRNFLNLFFPTTTFTAEFNFVPNLGPFFSPPHRSATGLAQFNWQVLFFHANSNSLNVNLMLFLQFIGSKRNRGFRSSTTEKLQVRVIVFEIVCQPSCLAIIFPVLSGRLSTFETPVRQLSSGFPPCSDLKRKSKNWKTN